jgi:hypothetical protein
MVYFVKTKNQNVRVFYSETEMISAGFKRADKTATEEEYNSNGCYVRLIDGQIVIGKTDDEKAQEEIAEKEAELKARLDQIDKEAGCGRAFRAVAIEVAAILHKANPNNETFDPVKGNDLKKIIEAEESAIAVRAELAPILAARAG